MPKKQVKFSDRNKKRQQAPAQKRERTVEVRLETLDRLAANGTISKEEYDRRR